LASLRSTWAAAAYSSGLPGKLKQHAEGPTTLTTHGWPSDLSAAAVVRARVLYGGNVELLDCEAGSGRDTCSLHFLIT
jgi:hypothetical protein